MNGGVFNPSKINQEILEKTKSFKSQITGVLDKCLKPLNSIQREISQLRNFDSILFTSLNGFDWTMIFYKKKHSGKLIKNSFLIMEKLPYKHFPLFLYLFFYNCSLFSGQFSYQFLHHQTLTLE